HRLHYAERARQPLQGVERLRAPRYRSDQARVAADSRTAVGIFVLRGSRDGARHAELHARPHTSRRVRPDAPDARLVRQLESYAGADDDRPVRGGVVTNPLTTGPNRAGARAMFKAVGFSDADLKKPLIGVANTWIEIGPCNYHLRELAAHVKDGIRASG